MDYKLSQNGFVVLIAVMVTTIVLTMGIGVLNLALREFILANVGSDSVKAFYAADTGIDCIFSHDLSLPNPPNDPTVPHFASPLPGVTNPNGSAYIVCNGQNLYTGGPHTTNDCPLGTPGGTECKTTILSRVQGNSSRPLAEEALCLNDNGGAPCTGACVTMEVRKIKLTDETQRTELVANGISDCQGSRSVERSLILTWE